MIKLDDKELREAWDRIARTADGLLIYRHLQKECLEPAASLDQCALPYNEGRRSLAFDLMANMSEGIGDNDRACVTFARAKPGIAKSTHGAARRVTLDHFIPGYDGPTDTGGAAGGSTNGAAS